MGLLLSVLFSYVGAMELVFIIRDIIHQIGLHQRQLQQSRDDSDDDLKRIQDSLRKSISVARRYESENIQCMQDGVLYENGYRVDSVTEDWIEVRRTIERGQDNVMNGNVLATRRSVGSADSDASDSLDHSSNSHDSGDTVIENENVPIDEGTANHSVDVNTNDGNTLRRNSSSPEITDIHFDAYSENYLRSLDGIKLKPMVRDEGGRRRRAFKSSQSGSSNSSVVSLSREEELKMFTSLEEEEFESLRNSNYKPLQYTSDPNLMAAQNSRRRKRSPAQDLNSRSPPTTDEVTDPWGDVKPEHFHDSDIWKRERATSIAETDDDGHNHPNESENDDVNLKERTNHLASEIDEIDVERCYSPVGKKYTKTSSFEKASGADHTRALNVLCTQTVKDDVSPESNACTKLNPNVSTSDELINANAKEHVLDNANANTFNELESFACESTTRPSFPEFSVKTSDADFSDKNDLPSIANDGKIEEFINYIQNLDNAQAANKLGFMEYQDDSHRLRHPSYNYDAKEIEDLNIDGYTDKIEGPFDDEIDDNNERKYDNQTKNAPVNTDSHDFVKIVVPETTVKQLSRDKTIDFCSHGGFLPLSDDIDTDIGSDSEVNNQAIKRTLKVDNIQSLCDCKTPDFGSCSPSDSQRSIAEIDFVFVDNSDQREVSPATFEEEYTSLEHTNKMLQTRTSKSRSVSYAGPIHDSLSLDNVRSRNENHWSDDSSNSGSKQSPKSPYNRSSSIAGSMREGSWISIESNTRYERSQSRFSDLEYIKGRVDWLDIANSNLNHQIDSDNYHHHRRYSETAETLEYIRGRDDWLNYEASRKRCDMLPHICESRNRLDISDQIDADEYHHRRCLSEIISYATKTSDKIFLAQGSPRSGRERSPFRVLRTDINKNEFIERYCWKSDENVSTDLFIDRSSTILTQHDVPDDGRFKSDRFIWIAEEKRSRSKSPFSLTITIDDPTGSGEDTHIIIPTVNAVVTETAFGFEDTTCDIQQMLVSQNMVNENVLADIIKTSEHEGIEVAVVNLKDDEMENALKEPIIVINESLDEESNDEDSQDPEESLNRLSIEGIVWDYQKESIENQADRQTTEILTTNDIQDKNETNENFISSNNLEETDEKSDNTRDLTASQKPQKNNSQLLQANTTLPTTHDLHLDNAIANHVETAVNEISSSSATDLSKTENPFKPKPSKSCTEKDNLDDLIQEGSLGPWFHK